MFELTINDKIYSFNFNMRFLREINKRVVAPVDGLKNVNRNIGLNFILSGVIDGDIEDLVCLLECAGATSDPRPTRAILDAYIDDESTDIDALFENVIDFLSSANCTKKAAKELKEAAEKMKAQQARKMAEV